MSSTVPQYSPLGSHAVADYAPLIGDATVKRIPSKLARLRDLRLAKISSSYFGTGVGEILPPLSLLLRSSGMRAHWRVIQGIPESFSTTKKIHNWLQGAALSLSSAQKRLYESVVSENATRMHVDFNDLLIVHDQQPLPLILSCKDGPPFIWKCHVGRTSAADHPEGQIIFGSTSVMRTKGFWSFSRIIPS